MGKPTFSIVMPTCYRPALLERAIQSVLNQTFDDFELIIVDDANSEETHVLVNSFRDSRLVLLQHRDRRGPAAAHNTGIRSARGRFVSFLDDDDEYLPTFLERTNRFFLSADPPVDFVWTGVQRVIDTPNGESIYQERNWPTPFASEEEAVIAATTIGDGFGLTIKAECIARVGLYDETLRVCEDTEYLFRLAQRLRCAVIPEILVKIHRHGNTQLTDRVYDELRLEAHERVLERHKDFLERYSGLYRIHYQRLAELGYQLGSKEKARKLMLGLIRRNPLCLTPLLDWLSYELFGKNARTGLLRGPLRRWVKAWKSLI